MSQIGPIAATRRTLLNDRYAGLPPVVAAF